MADQLDELTERQHYWLEHIRACEAAGQSTLQYAQAHGFESRAMYKARKLLVEKGFWPTAKGCGHSSHPDCGGAAGRAQGVHPANVAGLRPGGSIQ